MSAIPPVAARVLGNAIACCLVMGCSMQESSGLPQAGSSALGGAAGDGGPVSPAGGAGLATGGTVSTEAAGSGGSAGVSSAAGSGDLSNGGSAGVAGGAGSLTRAMFDPEHPTWLGPTRHFLMYGVMGGEPVDLFFTGGELDAFETLHGTHSFWPDRLEFEVAANLPVQGELRYFEFDFRDENFASLDSRAPKTFAIASAPGSGFRMEVKLRRVVDNTICNPNPNDHPNLCFDHWRSQGGQFSLEELAGVEGETAWHEAMAKSFRFGGLVHVVWYKYQAGTPDNQADGAGYNEVDISYYVDRAKCKEGAPCP